VVGSNYPESISQCMLDTIYDTSSEQIVDFATRGNNTLDLFITNIHSLIERSNSLPGLSDHDMILVQARTKAARTKAPQRRILLWKGADQTTIRSAVQDFTNRFIQDHTATSAIDNMWTDFTSAISKIIITTVPSKMSSTRATNHRSRQISSAFQEDLRRHSRKPSAQGQQMISSGTKTFKKSNKMNVERLTKRT